MIGMTGNQDRPWYAEGLRFRCTGCGDCCTGAPGYVWVNQQEIANLATALGFDDREKFESKYVRKIGIRKSLVEFPNGDCVFFDSGSRKCAVYAWRPRQCRTWPFWDSNLKSPESWAETCQSCPGSGKGKLYSLDQIEDQRKVLRI
jgi:Fe-S-cluster containining protein